MLVVKVNKLGDGSSSYGVKVWAHDSCGIKALGCCQHCQVKPIESHDVEV